MRAVLAILVAAALAVLLPRLALALFALPSCARAPSPLAPQIQGSIGTPNRGVLTESVELPSEGDGYKWLRRDDRHHGLPRFVRAIERAAARVAHERPGAMLAVGDLSARGGGRLLPHLSHRTGRDVDLLLYGDTVSSDPELRLPHPALRERRFALQPLADLEPDRRLPPDSRTAREVLAGLGDGGTVERLGRWLIDRSEPRSTS